MHRRRFTVVVLLALLSVVAGCGCCGGSAGEPCVACTSLETSPRHHEWVQIETKTGRDVRAYLTYPQVNKAVAAVVVIHENRGLNDWARSVADQLSEVGYVAIAPDMLSGTGPDGGSTESFASTDAAREGIYKLAPDQILDDLDAVADYVRGLKATTDKVAVAGFCWGGGQTFRYAAHNRDIAAAFVFYGKAPDADVMKHIAAPVYGFYGSNDHRITAAVPNVEKTMQQLGRTYEPVIYEGAGHGFMRSGEALDAEPANKKARMLAWQRWKKLLIWL